MTNDKNQDAGKQEKPSRESSSQIETNSTVSSVPAHTPTPWKSSGYRPFALIARDPNESTYKVGDDRFTPFVHFSGSLATQRANADFIVEAVNSHAERASLIAALRDAKELIRTWHNMGMRGAMADQAWAIYQQSPEMKSINAALAPTQDTAQGDTQEGLK